jgi:hypothetical protein
MTIPTTTGRKGNMPNKSSLHGGQFVTGTVSHGTLRPQDLLRRFAAELNRLMPYNAFAMTEEARGVADVLDDMPDEKDIFSAWDILTELMDELNTIAAREGNYYFGTTEGDGSDFGFWETEEDTEK